MKKIIKRLIDLSLPPGQSAFLWGPRKVGKTYWISHHLRGAGGIGGSAGAGRTDSHTAGAAVIDLLKTDEFAAYAARPSLLRERYCDHKGLIVIDEVQKVPALLDEVHWLIENRRSSFLLTGSSARKLRRGHANLLGGRAWRRIMTPLSAQEVEGFDLESALVSGLLPPHFLAPDPLEHLRAYICDYLAEEIAAEGRLRQAPSFTEFLRVAAITSSELLNYTNVARECGVSAQTVRTYFEILEDTHLGFVLPPWRKSRSRRMILTGKFYLFDVGVANYLARRRPMAGSSDFGKAFEHYLLMELKAYQAYRQPDLPIAFWRTSTGHEVDFLLGDKELAVEVKASARVHEGDLRGLAALGDDGPVKSRIVVSLETAPRIMAGVRILPWRTFLEALWGGKYF